ncbi:MAG: hypothetical protein MK214_15070 [Thalassotalea sp.]|nr:hypothetical protein [Thalassotalea sp.]
MTQQSNTEETKVIQRFLQQWQMGKLAIRCMCATTSDLFDYFELWLRSNSWDDVDIKLFVAQLHQIGSVELTEISYPVIESILKEHEILVIKDPILLMRTERTANECREFKRMLCLVTHNEAQ